jgi:hypothetical protein
VVDRLRGFALVTEWALTALLSVVAAVRNFIDPAVQTGPLRRALLASLHDNYVVLVFGLTLAIFSLKVSQHFMERWSTNHKAIKAVLDSAQKVYFKEVAQAAPDRLFEHRVTLFRARRHWRDLPLNPRKWWRWPPIHAWKRALSIHCRSGTAYQLSPTRLHIDDEDEHANEGIAGRAWFTDAQCIVTDMPEWPTACADPGNNPTCAAYANMGYLSVQRAAGLRVKSRSIGAHVIRRAAGVRWGVVVFDSREAKGVSPEKKPLMELTAYLLTQLV